MQSKHQLQQNRRLQEFTSNIPNAHLHQWTILCCLSFGMLTASTVHSIYRLFTIA